jgi:hypothetical protein
MNYLFALADRRRSGRGFCPALCVLGWLCAALSTLGAEPTTNSLLAQALAGPWANTDAIVFCTRLPYDDPHWYANIGYYCDNESQKAYTGNGRPEISKLCLWHVRSGKLDVLLDAQGGAIRDPAVYYDARKLVFSYRPQGTDFYHLYEIRMDGTRLRQLTFGDFDDYEPAFLPDGGIVFVSTRCRRWVNCWKTQVGILYRCDANGNDRYPISANTEHDNTPWVLPDGRILYTRWEYVDRSQVEFHHLWTMNPDGTSQAVFYGNQRPGIVMIDAKPVPSSDRILASFSPGHGVNEHAGIATLVNPNLGPDELAGAQALHKGRLIRDPFPVSAEVFLAARDRQLVLMNNTGKEQILYTHSGDEGFINEPRPVASHPRERVIPSRTLRDQEVGQMILADAYFGRNLPGVQRGEVKKLLILESLPKPVNFSGGPDLVSWLGTFTLERVLGTVPVEADGSAYFELPAHRQVFFVALDAQDRSIKRMQSFTSVMPGEVMSCLGCHEERNRSGTGVRQPTLEAVRRPPSKITPFAGYPDVLDFTRDIQPILDRHCVQCHGPERREGQVNLAADLGPNWSVAFFSLFAHRQVADGRNGLGNQAPRTLGSSASALLKKVEGSHYGVKASERDWRLLWLWIESGAPYAGSYAALRNEKDQAAAGQATARVFGECAEVMQRRCRSCHRIDDARIDETMALPFNYENRRKTKGGVQRPTGAYERIVLEHDPVAQFSINVLLNYSRPRLSPLLLGPLARKAGGYESCGVVFADDHDPDYLKLLAAIERGKADLEIEPRFGNAGFQPNRQYVRELMKFKVLPDGFNPGKNPVDVFQTDQAYWRSLWESALRR